MARRRWPDVPQSFPAIRLFTAYERSAFARIGGRLLDSAAAASDFARSEQQYVLRVLAAAFDGSTVPLALVMAGAWLSNAPLGVMASYLLAGVSRWLPHCCGVRGLRCCAPLWPPRLGWASAASTWFRPRWEQRWVDIRQATDDPGAEIENSWLFARHADPRS